MADGDLTDRVLFAGDRSDVEHWLHAFDLFVLPSYANEGVPQALMQAMAAPKRIVRGPDGRAMGVEVGA